MTHAAILDAFKRLPIDLRKYIQRFHKSARPSHICPECDETVYQSQLSNEISCGHGTLMCKLCKIAIWDENRWSGSEVSGIGEENEEYYSDNVP